jgi:hypothetical protein
MASSARSTTSKYPLNEEHSAFTAQLIDTFENGIENGPDSLSIENIFQSVKVKLLEKGLPAPCKSSRNDVGDLTLIENKFQGQHKKINEEFSNFLFKELKQFNDKIASEIQNLNLDFTLNPEGEKKKFILKKYPIFISRFLCNILSTQTPKKEDINLFYESLVQFIAILLLSEINRIKIHPLPKSLFTN